MITDREIAKVCHQVNKAYCEAYGDMSQVDWNEAPDWQKESAINGVHYHRMNPASTPADSHNEWLKEKEADGWKFGEIKDPEKKEHPCFVAYELLPVSQQAKDYIFLAVVRALEG